MTLQSKDYMNKAWFNLEWRLLLPFRVYQLVVSVNREPYESVIIIINKQQLKEHSEA